MSVLRSAPAHAERGSAVDTSHTSPLEFLVFLIIAYPVLAVTCPPCPHALRHCRVARNSSRGRHVVFVAQCNGWVLHVINITEANINHATAHRRRVPARPWETKEEEEGRAQGGGGGTREKTRKGKGKNHYAPVLLTDRRPGQAHRAYWACPVNTNQAMMGGVEVFRFLVDVLSSAQAPPTDCTHAVCST